MRYLFSMFLCGQLLGMLMIVIMLSKPIGAEKRKQKNCLWPADNGTFTAEPFTKTCFMSKDTAQKVDCTTLIRMNEFNHMKHCFQ